MVNRLTNNYYKYIIKSFSPTGRVRDEYWPLNQTSTLSVLLVGRFIKYLYQKIIKTGRGGRDKLTKIQTI